jgi:NADPH:quinone reductase-like Zn-dependent oxidoreductase
MEHITMKAAYVDRYGPPEVISVREIAAPVVSEHDVLVRQVASNVSPADCAMRSADPFIVRFFTGLLRPKAGIPGETIAGTVEAVGAKVTRFKAGDRVFGITELAKGALAELIAVPESSALAQMPEAMSFEQAGALPYSFLTAMPFLRDEAKLEPGQSILINGAAGSIGTVAVQLARNIGAHVTAVCSTRNVELVLSLGANDVIDRTKQDFTARREAYDVVFDCVGKSSLAACRDALKPGGIYLTTVPSWAIMRTMLFGNRAGQKRGKLATTGLRKAADKRTDMELLAEMVERGEVRAVIDRTYPLAEIAEAHRYVEAGTKAGDAIIAIG